MDKVGSSIAVAALSETIAFLFGTIARCIRINLIGVMTRMPAVVAFSVYAALAIFFNFALQMTCFAALLALNSIREEKGKVDCVPCVTSAPTFGQENQPLSRGDGNTATGDPPIFNTDSIPARFLSRYYLPVLLHPITKFLVIVLVVGAFFGAIYSMSNVQLGLEQEVGR